MDTNILVIGSGISGLTYAIKIAEKNPSLEIIMISKNSLLESNTRYAQGGIAVVSNFEKDSFNKHVEDTLIAGAGECDKQVVEFVVKEGYERLKELINWGTHFDNPSVLKHHHPVGNFAYNGHVMSDKDDSKIAVCSQFLQQCQNL